jgi:hypothetical protein
VCRGAGINGPLNFLRDRLRASSASCILPSAFVCVCVCVCVFVCVCVCAYVVTCVSMLYLVQKVGGLIQYEKVRFVPHGRCKHQP